METACQASPAPHAYDTSALRVAAAPALPQLLRFEGRTMQDHRDFMHTYETYLSAINALETQWSGAFAMPEGACFESKTKRMITRYEFSQPPGANTEDEWVAYFMQAKAPSHVGYTSISEAMKGLWMQTRWPKPESRMMNLQADMEALLDQFNLTDLVFPPAGFRAVITTKLTVQENKTYKHEVVPFCAWVTKLMKAFMAWEHADLVVGPTR
ncbi:hypothetical protein V7S43_008746 [Phytophthora oleae]|uniref:Uncharacterized protein n=1 Tax=Phytophthora oleae TaxID=2107226 RepID=A0ABD3FJ74_9STRA